MNEVPNPNHDPVQQGVNIQEGSKSGQGVVPKSKRGGWRPGAGRKSKKNQLAKEVRGAKEIKPDSLKANAVQERSEGAGRPASSNGKEAGTPRGPQRRSEPKLGNLGAGVESFVASVLAEPETSGVHDDSSGTGNDDRQGAQDHEDPHASSSPTVDGAGRTEGLTAEHARDSGSGEGRADEKGSGIDSGGGKGTESADLEALLDPINFVRTLCIPRIDGWQERVIGDCEKPGRSSIVAANGIGKTLLIAAIIRYFLATFSNCRVVIISKIYRQLEMMAAHSRGMQPRFDAWEQVEGKLRAPNGNEAVWFATPDPGAVESQHAVFETSDQDWLDWVQKETARVNRDIPNKGTLVLIRDECKSISDEVRDASERFQADWTFDFSSPGAAIGWFYETQSKARALHRCHKATAFDSSFIKQTWLDFMLSNYGKDSAIYRSSVLAEFTEAVEGALITLESVNRCLREPPLWLGGELVAGIDLAATENGDMTVIAVRNGNRIQQLISFRDSDPMRVAYRVIRELEILGVPRANVFADAGGVGAGIVSRLRELAWPINGIQFGGEAQHDKQRYKNRMTQMWDDLKIKIEDCLIMLPNHSNLISELVSRKGKTIADGSLKLESKQEMRARGLPSPDHADAVCLAMNSATGFKWGRTQREPLKESSDDGQDADSDQWATNASGFHRGF